MCLAFLMFGSIAVFGQKHGELDQIGTSMANFLKIGVGARATAMGDAYVALSNDISSIYWNPAGLATLKNNEALFQTTNWLLGTHLYFFGACYRIPSIGTIGLSINSFSSGDIQETTIWEPDGTGRKFNTSNFLGGLTYSRQMTDRFSVGITLKYISERLDRESAGSVAIDVGGIFVTNFFNNMRIGFTLANMGTRMQLRGSGLTVQYLMQPGVKYVRSQLGTDPWDIPLLFRYGLAMDIFNKDNIRLTIASDVMDSRDFSARINTGCELAIRDMLFARAGYRFRYDEGNFTFGGGLNLKLPQKIGLKLDYAYTDFGILKNTQMFSIIFTF